MESTEQLKGRVRGMGAAHKGEITASGADLGVLYEKDHRDTEYDAGMIRGWTSGRSE